MHGPGREGGREGGGSCIPVNISHHSTAKADGVVFCELDWIDSTEQDLFAGGQMAKALAFMNESPTNTGESDDHVGAHAVLYEEVSVHGRLPPPHSERPQCVRAGGRAECSLGRILRR